MPKPADVKAMPAATIKSLEEWEVSLNGVLEKVKARAAENSAKMEMQAASDYTDMHAARKKAAGLLGRLNDPSAGRLDRSPISTRPSNPSLGKTPPITKDKLSTSPRVDAAASTPSLSKADSEGAGGGGSLFAKKGWRAAKQSANK